MIKETLSSSMIINIVIGNYLKLKNACEFNNNVYETRIILFSCLVGTIPSDGC